jgi:hypothetical protein
LIPWFFKIERHSVELREDIAMASI